LRLLLGILCGLKFRLGDGAVGEEVLSAPELLLGKSLVGLSFLVIGEGL